MKILFIDFRLPYLLKEENYPVGGYAVELKSWLNGLVAINCQCGVLVEQGANQLVNKKTPYQLLETYDPNQGIKALKYLYKYLPCLYKVAKSFKPDVIVQGIPELQTGMMAWVAHRLKVPFVYRVASDLDVDQRSRNIIPLYTQFLYRYGLNKSSAILCQNQYQYEKLREKYPEKKLYIIYNPFVPFLETIESHSRAEKEYVAWLANFRYDKNLELLFSIASSLPAIDFKIAGMPVGKGDSETEMALAKLKKLPNVQFTGYLNRENVGHFLAKARILLNTSRWEGLSNTFLEAFSTGTPVVCTSRVDPDGLIARNQLGLTAEHDDQLMDKVATVLSMDDAAYAAMSSRCQQYVQSKHNPTGLAKEYCAILDKVITEFAR